MSCKRNMILAAGLIMLNANSYAEPPRIPSGAIKFNQQISPAFVKPAPRLNFQADLVILSAGFSNEFCSNACSDQLKNELGVERISPEKCSWQVTVKNIGRANSHTGKVELSYDSLGGAVRLTGNMPVIRVGHSTMVVISLNSSRKQNLYRKLNAPFKTKVDSTNTTVESDEGNNMQSVRMR